MKRVLTISLLLNAALLGWRMWPNQGEQVSAPPMAAIPQPPMPVGNRPSMTPSPVVVRSVPFQWNQLLARDYHDFVKHLRAIGCPQETVRIIVAADVHASFAPRVRELEADLARLAGGTWTDQASGWKSKAAWQAELLHLPEAEAAQVAEYLGEKAPAIAETAQGDRLEDVPVAVPLVAQPVDLAALNLDAVQLQAIKDLQQSFLRKIGGPNQDPNDPAYQTRWRTAQAEMDDLMQGLLGNQAFEDYQQQVLANAQRQQDQVP